MKTFRVELKTKLVKTYPSTSSSTKMTTENVIMSGSWLKNMAERVFSAPFMISTTDGEQNLYHKKITNGKQDFLIANKFCV